MRMKIGIITMHYNLNYGAVLQAYATKNVICDLGYDAEIINFINPDAKKNMKLFGGRWIDKLRACLYLQKRVRRLKLFKKFISEEICGSTMQFSDPSMINTDWLKYDVYVTGSDQTFNLFLSDNVKFREAYFMPLIKFNKMSYAASMGDSILKHSEESKKWVREALNTYDFLSVRENSAADFIETLGIKRPNVVLDPTLLLDVERWESLANEIKYEPNSYIFFYSVVSDKWVVDAVKQVAKKLNLRVVASHFKNRFEMDADFIRAEECGPREFLSLVKNAAFVCTSSFHGTVFSLLFRKKFLALSITPKGRIENLLSNIGLLGAIVTEEDDLDQKLSAVDFLDFDGPMQLLAQKKEQSLLFLRKSIEAMGQGE